MKRKKTSLLIMLLTIIGALKVSAWTGNALPTSGTNSYYLYNVGTGQFLGCGNTAAYGTRADVDDNGQLFDLIYSDGVFNISTATLLGSSNTYLGYDNSYFWVNLTNKSSFTFTSTGTTNEFTISDGTYYLTAASSGADITASTTAPTSENGYWMLVSASDRETYLTNNATSANPMDASFYIKDGNFNNTFVTSTFWNGYDTTNGMAVAGIDKGNSTNDDRVLGILKDAAEYNVYQTITVPVGYYKVSCRGYYCNNTTLATAATNKETGNEKIRSYMYATDNTSSTTTAFPFRSIFEGASPAILWWNEQETSTDYGYLPDVTKNKYSYEAVSYYCRKVFSDNEVFVKVTGDGTGTLTIGVKGDALTDAADFTAVDQFRLTYYGNATTVDTAAIHYADLQNEFATAKALSFKANYSASGTVTIYTNVPTALTDAVTTAAAAEYSAANYATLQQLLSAYRLSASSSLINLTEAAAYTPAATPSSVKASLNRTITNGHWNTICLPFAMTYAQAVAAFGDGTKIAAFTAASDGTLSFTSLASGESTTASTPYLINPGNTQSAYLIDGVTFTTDAATTVTPTTNYSFIGNYDNTTIASGNYFFNGGTLYKSTGKSTIKPFRAYFTLPAVSSAKEMSISIDGETTSINDIDADNNVDAAVYNFNGQLIRKAASSLGSLNKGLYIMNGKKIIVK